MTKPSGHLFKQNYRPAAIGANILYVDSVKLYISHDYGASWQLSSVVEKDFFRNSSGEGVFMTGTQKQLMTSLDSGRTFKTHYYNSFHINNHPIGLLIKDSVVYVSDQKGLTLKHLYTKKETLVDNRNSLFRFIVDLPDTLFGITDFGILKSSDHGYSWEFQSHFGYGNPSTKAVDHQDKLLLIQDARLRASFDYGKSFLNVDQGLEEFAYSAEILCDDSNCFLGTTNGIFIRPASEIDKRSIFGRVYYDVNHNDSFDSLDIPLKMAKVKLGIDRRVQTTDSLGLFSFEYVGKADSLYYLPAKSFYKVKTYQIPDQLDDTIDFAIDIDTTIKSVEVYCIPQRNARPGFQTPYNLLCVNSGANTVQAKLTISLDGNMQFDTMYTTSYSVTGQVIEANLTLSPFERRYIHLFGKLPADTALLGDTLIHTCHLISNAGSDFEPLDNYDTLKQSITGSFDPNDKSVVNRETLTSFESTSPYWVNYLIRFQNTGTDTAFEVRIHDDISLNHQPTTFEILGSSHSVLAELDPYNNLIFRFHDIQLPDSHVNEPLSHGYVLFKMKINPFMNMMDTVYNNAKIYFDFNPPVVTNYSKVFVAKSVVGVAPFNTAKRPVLYPVPCHGTLNIQADISITELRIYTSSGQDVTSEIVFNRDEMEVNFEALNPGLYYVEAICKYGSSVQPVILLKQ